MLRRWRELNETCGAHQVGKFAQNTFMARRWAPGNTCFVRLGGQCTLDMWRNDSNSEATNSSSSTTRPEGQRDFHQRVHGGRRKKGSKRLKGERQSTGNGKFKRKVKCRAERIRDWELRGGRRKPKPFSGSNGWQMHMMLKGSDEELVKMRQPDWTKPIPSTWIGVVNQEAAMHNTFRNSYTFNGNDEEDAVFRDFERVAEWS